MGNDWKIPKSVMTGISVILLAVLAMAGFAAIVVIGNYVHWFGLFGGTALAGAINPPSPTCPAGQLYNTATKTCVPEVPPATGYQTGTSSTVTLNSFTGTWGEEGARTEVYPTYTVTNLAGAVILSDAAANSTTSSIGQSLNAYCTGAAYYCDPVYNFGVTDAAPTLEMDAYTVAATSDLAITIKDEDGTALVADDNSNNTADYAGGARIADETYTYSAKLKVGSANRNFNLGAIATYYCGGEVDDFTLSTSGWSDSGQAIPKAMKANFNNYDDGNASTQCNWQHYYVPSAGAIMLHESDYKEFDFVLDTGSTGPSANGDSYVGAVFLDASYDLDVDGKPAMMVYKVGDNTEDPGAVGLDENPETTFSGLQTAFTIEPQ